MATSSSSLYVGNLSPQVTQALLFEIFSAQSLGEVTSTKIITDKLTGDSMGYGFVDFRSPHSAEMALKGLNGRKLYGSEIKVNWAVANSGKEDTGNHHHIFVGDLSPEVTDETLWEAFKIFDSVSEARVLKDPAHNRSRGYGFVAFRDRADAEHALRTMNGVWLGSRPIRVNWANQKTAAAKNSGLDFETLSSQTQSTNSTIYVGNLAPDSTEYSLRQVFEKYGRIDDIRMQCDKGYAFVKYFDHNTATRAILGGNGETVGVRTVRCSWGKEKSASESVSAPVPPFAGIPATMPFPYPMYPGMTPFMMYNSASGLPPYGMPAPPPTMNGSMPTNIPQYHPHPSSTTPHTHPAPPSSYNYGGQNSQSYGY